MARTTSYANAFTAGEIGENAWERSDLQQHAKGCAAALNMIALVTGPLASRGGFWDRGAVAVEAEPSRIVGFVRSSEDALLLELGHLTARVWTTAGNRVLAAGVPYAFVTPWTGAQLARLWFKQIGDVLYVTDLDGGPARVIKRLADTDWSVELFDFREGPWLTEQVNGGPTLQSSALAGATTLTASSPVFSAADVGTLVQIRESDGSPGLQTWTSDTDYTGGQRVQFDGRVYERTAGGATKSGTTPPLHSEGVVSDGSLFWIFVHDGRGVARITAYVSATQVSATVIRPIPTMEPTRFWSKQAYSAIEGYPRALAEEREERLIFGASLARPGTVDATRTAGFGPAYGDFKPGLGTGRVVEDDAVRLDVGGASRVVWLLSAAVLLAGCTDGEYVVSGRQMDEPMTPDTRRSLPVSAYGNADVAPLLIEGPPPAILHVLRSRKTLRELKVSPDLSVESRNLSILAHHIFERGVAAMAWQQARNIVWLQLDDGGLAAMAYDMEQQVVAATRQPLPEGWTVESLDCASAPGGGDVLMMTVKRTKGETTQRRVWLLADRSERMFMDGAQRYLGATVTTVSGLDHYEGETVTILADGGRVSDREVVDGTVTLPSPASDVVIGQRLGREFESLPLDMEGTGSTNARTTIPTHATVILTAAEATVGTTREGSADTVRARAPGDLAGPVEKRLRKRIGVGNGSGRDERLVIRSDAPFDLVLHAYRLEGEVTR